LALAERRDFNSNKYNLDYPELVNFQDANMKHVKGVHDMNCFCNREMKKFNPDDKPKSILIKKKHEITFKSSLSIAEKL
jgi:hypothetical protein